MFVARRPNDGFAAVMLQKFEQRNSGTCCPSILLTAAPRPPRARYSPLRIHVRPAAVARRTRRPNSRLVRA